MSDEKRWLKRHDDDEWFDEIRIRTVPRFKTSGLSGDEWRVSARVEFMRKGVVVAERDYSTLKYAVMFLTADFIRILEEGVVDAPFQKFCMQPGCDKAATTVYRLKQSYCADGHASDPAFPMYRQFCTVHSRRGDCGLEDADANYEVVDGHGPQDFWEHDESPAVFGGIIDLREDTDE